jgi:murein DD-endopeptidase MepM/ murein hydrolase activator NlpD
MPTITAAPIDSRRARITSSYGLRRSQRNPQETRMHAGLDISARDGSEGLPVYAVLPGTVYLVSRDTEDGGMRGYGNAVVIQHETEPTFALYAHLRTVTVAQGQRVGAGAQIGTVGNTSNGKFSPRTGESASQFRARMQAERQSARVMAPHLHLEVRTSKEDGSAPFPGPYPTTPAQARYNRDPQPWLASHGMTFERRGGITFAAKALAGLGSNEGYVPPVPDRDARFGLTPGEWQTLGIGAAVGLGALVLFLVAKK